MRDLSYAPETCEDASRPGSLRDFLCCAGLSVDPRHKAPPLPQQALHVPAHRSRPHLLIAPLTCVLLAAGGLHHRILRPHLPGAPQQPPSSRCLSPIRRRAFAPARPRRRTCAAARAHRASPNLGSPPRRPVPGFLPAPSRLSPSLTPRRRSRPRTRCRAAPSPKTQTSTDTLSVRPDPGRPPLPPSAPAEFVAQRPCRPTPLPPPPCPPFALTCARLWRVSRAACARLARLGVHCPGPRRGHPRHAGPAPPPPASVAARARSCVIPPPACAPPLQRVGRRRAGPCLGLRRRRSVYRPVRFVGAMVRRGPTRDPLFSETPSP